MLRCWFFFLFVHVVHFRCHFCFGGLAGNLCSVVLVLSRCLRSGFISAPQAPRTETLVDGLPCASTFLSRGVFAIFWSKRKSATWCDALSLAQALRESRGPMANIHVQNEISQFSNMKTYSLMMGTAFYV